MAHVDMWIERQRVDGAAQASIARRVSAVPPWYKYLIANTTDDPLPLALRNPTDGCANPDVDPDYAPTVGLSRVEADRLIAAADADNVKSSALIPASAAERAADRVGDGRAD